MTMKKWLLFLILCLLPLCAAAESKTAVVANPNVSDRLALRRQPSQDSAVIGRFYSGTPVTVLSEKNGWCEVQLGNLKGYMSLSYLAYDLPNYEMPRLFYFANPAKRDAPIYNKASTSGQVVGRANDTVHVLGDINDDWRYVLCNGQYGYMRIIHMEKTTMRLEQAYLSSKIELCSDKELKKGTGAVYYGNTRVRVIDASRSGYWAKIEVTGHPGWSGLEGPMTQGYVPQNYLNIFVFPWQMTRDTYAVGRLTQGTFLTHSHQGEDDIILYEDTLVTIIGETQTHYHVLCQGGQDMVEKDILTKEKGRTAGIRGIEPIGFALLKPGDDKRWAHNALTQLISINEAELQIAYSFDDASFMDRFNVIILRNEDLLKYLPPMPEGDFAVTEETSAIWHFVVEEGQTATLTMHNDPWHIHIENQVFTKGSYSYYLPAGTKGTLSGATWHSDKASTPNIMLYTMFAEDVEKAAFSGSARYYCDWQISNNSMWYNYRVEAMEGCDDAYYIITDLNTLDGEEPRKVDLSGPLTESEEYIGLQPGQFVELHNCVLYYDFGNG